MSTCVPTPVSTAFSTVTGENIITTYSLSTSAVPPVVTIHVEPFCQNEAVVLDSTVCLKSGTRTSTEILQRTSTAHLLNFPIFAHFSRFFFFLSFFHLFEFRKLTPSPIHSSAMTAFNCRHELPRSGMVPGPIPTRH